MLFKGLGFVNCIIQGMRVPFVVEMEARRHHDEMEWDGGVIDPTDIFVTS